MKTALRTLILLLLLCFVVWRVHLGGEVNRRLSAIRAAGLPISPRELDQWYQRPPEPDNAAPVLVQAFALARDFPDKRSNTVWQPKLLDRRAPWDADTRNLVAQYVSMNADSLAKAREAVQRPRCRYPVDLSYGTEAELPHLSALKRLACATALRALLAAQEGRVRDWQDDVRLMLQLATTLDREPIFISQLVRATILTVAVQTTEHCLNLTASDGSANELIAAFAGAINTNSIRVGLIGERAMATPVFRMSLAEMQRRAKSGEGESSETKPPPLAGRPNPILWLTGCLERDLNFYLRAMDTNIALATLPPPASLAATNVVEEFSETACRQHYIYSSMLLPMFSKAVLRNATTVAHLRLAQAALAVENFRAVRGRLPESLSQITPQFLTAVPTDPFDGAPLRYHRLEKGYVVYSVDRDGHDDGGRERLVTRKPADQAFYDLTFTVER